MAESNLLLGKYLTDEKDEGGKKIRAYYERFVRDLILEGNGARRKGEHRRDPGREPDDAV